MGDTSLERSGPLEELQPCSRSPGGYETAGSHCCQSCKAPGVHGHHGAGARRTGPAQVETPGKAHCSCRPHAAVLKQVFNLQSFGKVDLDVSCHCSQCFTERIFRCPCSTAVEFEGPSLVTQTVKNLSAVQETWVRSWAGKIPREGSGNPRQYSCLENSMD